MRIAVLTSSYPRFNGDGAAPFVKSIVENMSRLGHEIEVVAPFDPAVDVTQKEPASNLDPTVHRFRYIWPDQLHIMGHARAMEADVRLRPLALFLIPLYLLGAFIKLYQVTGSQKTEIIHVHWVIPNGPIAACVAALRHIPFVVSLHGSDIFFSLQNRLFGGVARRVFRQASAVTACSPELRDGAAALGATNVFLQPWGADPKIFNPQRRSELYRQAFGLESVTMNKDSSETDDRIIISALGRLVHKKGFDRLVAAWAKVADQYPQAHLVIGGDGPLRSALDNQIHEQNLEGRVSLVGQIRWDEVPEFLASSDVFVLPSVQDSKGNMDGLPTVLLEAMSSGLAVVASRLGGIPLVIEDGETGILVTPDDVPALEAALDTVLRSSNRQELGRAARRSIEQTYNWPNVVRSILLLMSQVTKQSNINNKQL